MRGISGRLLLGLGLVALRRGLPRDERRHRIDQVLEAQARIDEALDLLDPQPLDVATHARRVVRHPVDHPAVGLGEEVVVLEEVDVPQHVRDDHLLIDQRVPLQQVRIGGVVVDHHLVDLREAVDVALGEVLELHAEAPVRVADREAAERRHLLHLLVVEDLELDVPEVEAVLPPVVLDLALHVGEVGGQLGTSICPCPGSRESTP